MKSMWARIGAGVALTFVALFFVAQRACDRAGNWPHTQETRVYLGSDWPKDQMRKCAALPRADGTIYFLGCVDSIENYDEATPTEVTYWGRVQREDRFQALHSESMDGWHWNCKNNGSSLTCYAVN